MIRRNLYTFLALAAQVFPVNAYCQPDDAISSRSADCEDEFRDEFGILKRGMHGQLNEMRALKQFVADLATPSNPSARFFSPFFLQKYFAERYLDHDYFQAYMSVFTDELRRNEISVGGLAFSHLPGPMESSQSKWAEVFRGIAAAASGRSKEEQARILIGLFKLENVVTAGRFTREFDEQDRQQLLRLFSSSSMFVDSSRINVLAETLRTSTTPQPEAPSISIDDALQGTSEFYQYLQNLSVDRISRLRVQEGLFDESAFARYYASETNALLARAVLARANEVLRQHNSSAPGLSLGRLPPPQAEGTFEFWQSVFTHAKLYGGQMLVSIFRVIPRPDKVPVELQNQMKRLVSLLEQ